MTVVDTTGPALEVRRSRTWLLVVPLTAIVSVAATLGVVHLRDRDQTADPHYVSTHQMAEHLGCTGTYRPAANPGASLSAGQCTYRGATVDMVVYATALETSGWFDGTGQQNPGTAGIFAGHWAARVHTTDLALANEALGRLQ